MEIEYIKIDSSNIIGYYYDDKSNKLYIKFGNRREYEYSNVSEEEMIEIHEADSFGKKFREIILGEKKYKEIT